MLIEHHVGGRRVAAVHAGIVNPVRGVVEMNPGQQGVLLCVEQLIENKEKENGRRGTFRVALLNQ
jgi:hypothetical protein